MPASNPFSSAERLDVSSLAGHGPSIRALGFDDPVDVRSSYGIGALFPNKKRRFGIYLLVLNGGHFYIGRATDVVQRFSAHRRTFGERLIGFSFQHLPLPQHVELERDLIKRGERTGLALEQVEWVSQVYGTSDLDELVTGDEFAAWASDPLAHLAQEQWPLPASSAGRQARDIRMLAKFESAVLAPSVVELLSLYVQHCVPLPRRTAPDYWNIACMPSTNARSYPRLACVSAHVMETFVVGNERDDPESMWSFVVCARHPLKRTLVHSRRRSARSGASRSTMIGPTSRRATTSAGSRSSMAPPRYASWACRSFRKQLEC